MDTQTIRIAVRKFAPFEEAIRRQFDDFCMRENVRATLVADALDLNELHPALFDRGGLRDGSYDIAFVVTDWLAAAVEDGLLADLEPLRAANPMPDFESAWSPSLSTLQRMNGGVYGVPYHDGPECLIYRTDLIDRPPATWDEFLATSARVARPGLHGAIVAAYADGHNTVYDFALQVWTRGGELADADGRPTLDTPAARAGLAFYRTLVRHPATVPGATEIHSVPAGERFMRGEVAMMANWFGFASAAQTLPDSAVRGKVGIAPIPAGPGARSASLNVYWLLAIASGSKNPSLAWRFLRHCASREMDKLLTLGGAVGTRLSTWRDADVNAAIPFFAQLPELHENARTLPNDRRFPELAHIIERAVLRAIHTEDDVAAILRDAQREADETWGGQA